MALYTLVYSRVSTDAQSLDVQMAAFEAIGFDFSFTEKVSGRRGDRPQFLALVAKALELRQQRHDVRVFVHEWTRFARNTAVALEALATLEDAGCTVLEATTGQAVTLATSDGFLTTGMKSVMAEHFSRQLSDRMKRSYSHRKAKGRPSGNRPPFGYQYSPDGWVPSDDWVLARACIEHFLEHGSIRRLVTWMASQGHQRSRTWASHWLQSPAIRGHQEYKGELVYGTHEPLITEQEWAAIRHKLETNRQLRGKNTTATRHAVPNSLCVCASCGRKLTSKSRQGARYFLCPYATTGRCEGSRKYCRDEWVEAAIQNEIQAQAERVIEWHQAGGDATDPRLAEKQRELEQLRGLAHVPGVAEAIALLESEIEQIKTATHRQAADSQEREQMICDLATLYPEDWAKLSAEQRRGIYSELVREVRVAGAEVLEVRLS